MKIGLNCKHNKDKNVVARHFIKPSEAMILLGSMSASVVAIVAVIGLLMDWIPAKASDLEAVKREVATVKTEVATIALAQQESLELQLMTRLHFLESQIPDTTDTLNLQGLQQGIIEIKQRLTRSRIKIDDYISR